MPGLGSETGQIQCFGSNFPSRPVRGLKKRSRDASDARRIPPVPAGHEDTATHEPRPGAPGRCRAGSANPGSFRP
jgi:hypothetical protein